MLIAFQSILEKYKFTPTGILHCGAHFGEEAKDYAEMGVNNVMWIEAMPDAYEVLKNNLRQFAGQMCLKACLGDEDFKEVTFNVSSNEGQSSSYLELGTHAEVHPDVTYIANYKLKTLRIDTIFKHNKIDIANYDFLNMDLQGAELFALKGMGKLLHKVKYAYIEVNKAELYKGCPLIEEIDAYLKQFGLIKIQVEWVGNTNWGDCFYAKEEFITFPPYDDRNLKSYRK